MRTKAPMLFVAAVLVAGMAWQLAGMSAALGLSQSSPTDGVPVSQLNESADKYNPEDGVSGQAPGSDAGGLIGIAISGGQDLANLIAMAVLLPVVLDNMGMPYYWAYPLGLLAQIISFIGIVQFATNRNLR